jgi:hypothetical protein
MSVSLPQEITDKIIDAVAKDPALQIPTLRACSLVSRTWVYRSQRHLFSNIELHGSSIGNWRSAVRPGEDGPSHHVTRIRYHAGNWDSYRILERPNNFYRIRHSRDDPHMSSFTNLQTLCLHRVALYRTAQLSIMHLRSTVRTLELEDCLMDINDFVSFLRPFTNLERVSLLNPSIQGGRYLREPVEYPFPTLEGTLDLKISPDAQTSSFLRGLSFLPLAVRAITLRDYGHQVARFNRKLVALRDPALPMIPFR